VIVRSAAWTDTTVTVEIATRGSGGWRCGTPMSARVGRSGMRPLLERRSGDGTTPAGVFPLATMTAHDGQRFSFFGNAPDPGVTAGTYRRVQTGDCFGATPNTPGYGHLRYDTSCPGPDDEYLPRFVNAYTNAALIGANMEPEVSGDAPGEIPYASAIFLHRHSYVSGSSGATKPTAGCVSLAQRDLTSVLVDMTADTVFVIGTTDWLLTTA
jgi:L,D-peptidoglycan transpeptidase YkuD (ErfK/YbiS/YcfS/YnhG family)